VLIISSKTCNKIHLSVWGQLYLRHEVRSRSKFTLHLFWVIHFISIWPFRFQHSCCLTNFPSQDSVLFPRYRSPCPALSSIDSQLFHLSIILKFYSVLKTKDNFSAWGLSYQILCHVNILFDRRSCFYFRTLNCIATIGVILWFNCDCVLVTNTCRINTHLTVQKVCVWCLPSTTFNMSDAVYISVYIYLMHLLKTWKKEDHNHLGCDALLIGND
jgi:hypothetical protein